jgi:2'-5' RNA ligase
MVDTRTVAAPSGVLDLDDGHRGLTRPTAVIEPLPGCGPEGIVTPSSASGVPLNCYALVSYLPDPLAGYLDQLRKELVPFCSSHAHVTILPPRPLPVDWQTAWSELRPRFRDFRPFEVELQEVCVFDVSSVIYLELGRGSEQFFAMHAAFNQGVTRYDTVYPYHPHVTLAQQITPEQVPGVFDLARKRWAEYEGERRFQVDRAFFVQNTSRDLWIDWDVGILGAV